MEEDDVRRQTIYLVKHGSVAYGTNTPTSDVDEKGVAVPCDKNFYYGNRRFEQKDSGWVDGNDRVIYDLRKFVSLAADCNPNIVEVLYVSPDDRLKLTYAGAELIKMRTMFLSQKAAYTFVGYAVSQLKRIEGHYKWLNNPPKEPKVEDFTKKHLLRDGEIYQRKFGGHEITAVSMCGPSGWMEITHVDHEAFDAAKKDYKNFLHWKENRNPARAAIEAQYGYDCKHAYHLVRLLRMGKEILSEGKVLVKRPDAEELLAIRNGLYTYPELLQMAQDLKSEVDKSLSSSFLPKEPDRKSIEQRMMHIIEMCLHERRYAFHLVTEPLAVL